MNVIGTNDVNAGNLIFAYGGNNSIIFGSFLPLDLPNLLGWYSSDYGVYNAPGVLATDGQTVRTWQNKVNNGIDLNQGGVIAPIYSNGAIQFSQNAMSGINPYALNAPLTYYVATQTILSGSNQTASIIKHDNSSTIMRYRFGVTTGAFLNARAAQSDINSNFLKLTNPKNVIYLSFSGTAGSNGQVIVGQNNLYETFSQTFGTNTSNIFIIGSNMATTAINPLKGSIYEILIYTGLHTETEKNQVITYLSNKWGVSF